MPFPLKFNLNLLNQKRKISLSETIMLDRLINNIFPAILICLVITNVALATQEKGDRPKVGLVLSGGGARGFAHVGAISVIKEAGIPIDYVTGSSMGSVIGALYAIGYTPEEMEEIIHTIDWDRNMSDSGLRKFRPIEEKRWDGRHLLSLPIKGISVELPNGLLNGQNISETLSRLTWRVNGTTNFDEFPIPFACVATDLETGLPHVIRSGYLPDALRASIALPTLFTPKVINGHTLIDGGLVMNVPVVLARDMGADIIITVDATSVLDNAENLGNILEIMNQTMLFQMIKSNKEQLQLSDVIIKPDVQDHYILNFDNPDDVIEYGREAARAQLSNLKKIADSLQAYDPLQERGSIMAEDSIYISDIEFKGLSNVSLRLAKDQMDIEPGSRVSRLDIEKGISKLYGLDYFLTVNYNIDHDNPANTLIINVNEREIDKFHFGFNYKNRKGASLYFNTTYRNLIAPSSTLRISMGLGREPFIDGQYFNYLGQKSKFSLRSQVQYKQYYIDLYNEGSRISNVKANTFKLNFLVNPVLSTNFIIRAGFREEVYSLSRSIGMGLFPSDWSNTHLPYLLFELDTLDDMLFPTRGYKITAQSDLAVIPFASSVNYMRHSVNWSGYIPLHKKGSLVANVNLGLSNYGSMPLYQRFYLGGYPDFLGYYPQEFSGDQIKSLQVGYQHHFDPGIYIYAAANIGNTDFTWDSNPLNDQYHTGAGLNLRTDTRLGPLGITFSASKRHSMLVELNAGFQF